jgi:putative hydrolase of the HAD superfamily
MHFQAVLFDLFGTIVLPFASERFHRSLAEMADAVKADRAEFRRMWIEETVRDRSTGCFPTIEANVLHICRALGIEPRSEELADAAKIREAFTREILIPRPDAVSTMRALRSAGLRLALVSDCSSEVPRLWPGTPFAALIDAPVFSCSTGTKKPDPRIYRMAVDTLGVSADRCIYVGDGFSNELTGAATLGMHPLLIAPPGEVAAASADYEGMSWTGGRIETLGDIVKLLGIKTEPMQQQHQTPNCDDEQP